MPSVTSSMSWSDDGIMKEKGTDESLITCEGGGDVVGVLTLLVGGVAQAFHDDRVVELRVQLGVQEVDVEREKRVKEGAPWMVWRWL